MPSTLAGDYLNIVLLLLLYTLQGLPLGLGRAVPMLLKDRGASFAELGTFSLQSWPFSLKLLWAPLVDCLYVQRFGRRKTWMVPSQLLIGLIMIVGSSRLTALLDGSEKPAILPLTLMFLAMNFLCATQDIAVDGWALTMLSKENTAYQATCNAAGQTLGFTLGLTGMTLLEEFGWLDLPGFMLCVGVAFIIITLAVAALKPEAPLAADEEPDGIVATYSAMLAMLKLRTVRALVLVLFTWKLGFAVVDSVAPLKFQEYGVPKAHMTYLSSLLVPLEIALPMLASVWTAGPTPFNLAMRVYPFKVAVVPITAALAYGTPPMEPFPWAFWLLMLLVALVGAICTEWMFVSQISLFAKVSAAEPALGGTYMTFLNTVANLGQKLPPTATFFLVDRLTCRGESCLVDADGFYVMTGACTVIGIAWYVIARGPVRRMQALDVGEWKVGPASRAEPKKKV